MAHIENDRERLGKTINKEKPTAQMFVYNNPNDFTFVLNQGTFGVSGGRSFGISSDEDKKNNLPAFEAEARFYKGLAERIERFIEVLKSELAED
jgi:hypothetical protein